MRVTSLNLRGFFDWQARAPRIEAYLRQADPDVILFQEVVFLPEVSAFTPADLLNRRLQYPYHHGSVTRLQQGRQYPVYREGLAMLSRLPVPTTEALVLRHEQGDPHQRIVQLLDVREDGHLWRFADVHLSVKDEFAIHHLKELLGILEARGERRILGGDFNVNHLERHAALWRGRAVLTSEVQQYVSHPGTDENDDYFLVPDGFGIGRIQLSGDELSDHRAVTVDLEVVAAEGGATEDALTERTARPA
jgi:endonuclease/exonuclease/phosphatase family metal-dependent hydrolase